jgi:hypothetical protein
VAARFFIVANFFALGRGILEIHSARRPFFG